MSTYENIKISSSPNVVILFLNSFYLTLDPTTPMPFQLLLEPWGEGGRSWTLHLWPVWKHYIDCFQEKEQNLLLFVQANAATLSESTNYKKNNEDQ